MDEQIFQSIIQKNTLLCQGDSVVVGVSAGPDSTALLCLLCRCNIQLHIIPVYIDHGLRPNESIEEKQHVETLAKHFGIPFEFAHIDAASHKRSHGTSLEESCRILRYRVFDKIKRKYKADAIALGHTADDQAEEMLLRLFRGTGLQGLSGMSLKNGFLIRPLLHTSKDELIRYLDRLGIDYCIDSSNADKSILRNRLRLDVLPAIEKHFNPAVKETLLRTSAILQEENAFLDESANEAFFKCTSLSGDTRADRRTLEIDVESFHALHGAIKRRVAEKAILAFGVHPDFHHIDHICYLAAQGRNGMEHHLPYGLRVYVSGQVLVLDQPGGRKKQRRRKTERNIPARPIDLSLDDAEILVSELGHRLRLQKRTVPPANRKTGEILLDLDKLSKSVILRSPHEGERFVPEGMTGRKKVNRFLSDQKIVQQNKHLYPVLVDGEDVIGVVGLRADARYAPDSSTALYLLISWLPMGSDTSSSLADG